VTALQYFKSVTSDKSNLLERFLKLLEDNSIHYCLIGGAAVSAYVEPLVSLDFDLVVTDYQVGRFTSLLANTFVVKRGPRLIEITAPNSRLRVNVHTDSRLAEFVERSGVRNVFDMSLPVARIEDVLSALVRAFEDTTRSAAQRRQDLMDMARLLELSPRLRSLVPGAIQQRLSALGV
jgi:hypothetical protein